MCSFGREADAETGSAAPARNSIAVAAWGNKTGFAMCLHDKAPVETSCISIPRLSRIRKQFIQYLFTFLPVFSHFYYNALNSSKKDGEFVKFVA